MRTMLCVSCVLAVACTARSAPTAREATPAWVPLSADSVLAAREADRAHALERLDTTAIARVRAPDYRVVTRSGIGDWDSGMAAVLRHIKSEPPIDSIRVDSAQVEVFGDAAVVVGHEHIYMTGTYAGKPYPPSRFAAHDVFTDVWRRTNGQWLLLSAQHMVYDFPQKPM